MVVGRLYVVNNLLNSYKYLALHYKVEDCFWIITLDITHILYFDQKLFLSRTIFLLPTCVEWVNTALTGELVNNFLKYVKTFWNKNISDYFLLYSIQKLYYDIKQDCCLILVPATSDNIWIFSQIMSRMIALLFCFKEWNLLYKHSFTQPKTNFLVYLNFCVLHPCVSKNT